MTTLGVNEHHGHSIINFMRFSKYRRGQHLRSVDRCSSDLKESRLSDQMYTSEEVSDLLDSLNNLLKAELESELINATHTNILLLQQMFEQAEKWHLKLQVDVSQLENRELLDKIKEFEEQELIDQTDFKHPTSPVRTKLEPLGQTEGPIGLLNAEIEKLNEENQKLKKRLAQIESQASSYLHDKEKLSKEVAETKILLSENRETINVEKGPSPEEIDAMQEQVFRVRQEMEETLKFSSDNQRNLEGDLTSTKHQLLEVQAQLELAEKELEKKFSKTAAYNNMKKMLLKKNEQIKELRQRLGKHEVVVPVD